MSLEQTPEFSKGLKAVIQSFVDTFDRKEMDINGWPEFKDNPISKAGIFEYYGRNIDASLEPDKLYRVLRAPEELSRPETIESFKLVPWIDEHVMLGPDGSGMEAPENKGIEGVIGENVYYDASSGYLRANIKVFSNNMQELHQAGKRELSAGYRCKYKKIAGVWNGQPYDVIQTDIRGNHLALVKQGRMGPDVAVLDHLFQFTFDAREAPMAMDPEMKKEMDALTKAVADGIKAMDAKLDEGMKAIDKRAKDAEEKMDKECKDRAAKDADEDKKEEEKKAEDKKAMDASIKAGMDAAFAPLKDTIATLTGMASKQTAAQDAAAKTSLMSKLSDFGYAIDGADKLELPALRKAAAAKIGVPCTDGQEQVALDAFFHGRELPPDEVGFALDTAKSGDALDKFFKAA